MMHDQQNLKNTTTKFADNIYPSDKYLVYHAHRQIFERN